MRSKYVPDMTGRRANLLIPITRFFGIAIAVLMLLAILMPVCVVAQPGNDSESIAVSKTETKPLITKSMFDLQEKVRAKMLLPAQRESASERNKAVLGEALAAAAYTLQPGTIPHYFGPYPNYANSPMPKGSIAYITVDSGGSGYISPTVTVTDVYGTGSGATATATQTGGAIASITVTNPGAGYTAPIIEIADAGGQGTGAAATSTLGTLTGGMRKFVDTLPAIPIATPDQTAFPPGGVGYASAPDIIITDSTGTGANATATVQAGTVTSVTVNQRGGGYSANPTIRFSGGSATTHAIGKAVVENGEIVAINLLGCDYYEIELGEFTLQMHSDLANPTKLRGYRQVNTNSADPANQFSYLGPLIVAERDRPVRIKFINRLPIGSGGDLFLPVDTTVMGSGEGPNMLMPMDIMSADLVGGGPTIEIKTMNPHNFNVGMKLQFKSFEPAAYNGVFRMTARPDDMHFQVTLKSNPGVNATTIGHITEMYAENRATLHLHGGYVPWISDGTPHQWITPAGESTNYPKGVSVRDIPDMQPSEDGSMTFFYNNQQSARLMFYHDHAYGITRLNVYAGEAAGYLITDQVEKDMIEGTNVSGVNPAGLSVLPGLGIPLVIQDKSFVDADTIGFQDPTWNWGTGARDSAGNITHAVTGDLWYPHVYMPNQNPADIGGMNAFGRWHYGPWFWPPTTLIEQGPKANPYFNASDPSNPMEPPLIPGVPDVSMAMEAFMDTPMVNGVAYPTLDVEPKAYRFRILNAADDRFLNLQLYEATSIISGIQVTKGGKDYTAPEVVITDKTGRGAIAKATVSGGVISGITMMTVGSGYTKPTVSIIDPTGSGAKAEAIVYTDLTEVGMVSADSCGNLPPNWPTDGREGGVPDPAKKGPSFIQIGNEGGFLPSPAELTTQPINWNMDQTNFDFGNVNQGTLIVGTAERADVIVDFSRYAGKTLILYNDAPAPFPAIDPRYDYYTGHPDMTDTGGTPTTQPGYGPNTRTIMQINVLNTAASPAYDLNALKTVFEKTDIKRGVFEVSQDEIIVPQAEYNSAYGRTDLPEDPYIRIDEGNTTFKPLSSADNVTMDLEPKAIQDEMGETYDKVYGRMSAMLGLQLPVSAGPQQFTMYPFASPPVEIIKESLYGTKIGSLGDGTQIWKITHNGVDTHTIHVHLFNAQLINRVAWDNAIRVPDLNELGWKETFRVNPLQDTFIALRPIAPTQPFEVPNSERLIDPTMPDGVMLADSTAAEANGLPPVAFAPNGEPIDIKNHAVNLGWEYVYHCHLLAHEEMDMMHGMAFAVAPLPPTNLVAVQSDPNSANVTLTWTDNSNTETGFLIQRDTSPNFNVSLVTFPVGPNPPNGATYVDSSTVPGTTYYYRMQAINLVGDTFDYSDPNLNEGASFPTKTAYSAYALSNPISVTQPPLPVAASPLNATITTNQTIVSGQTNATEVEAMNQEVNQSQESTT